MIERKRLFWDYAWGFTPFDSSSLGGTTSTNETIFSALWNQNVALPHVVAVVAGRRRDAHAANNQFVASAGAGSPGLTERSSPIA
jgi:hypothetical protein